MARPVEDCVPILNIYLGTKFLFTRGEGIQVRPSTRYVQKNERNNEIKGENKRKQEGH